jgi:hypothetical protein
MAMANVDQRAEFTFEAKEHGWIRLRRTLRATT